MTLSDVSTLTVKELLQSRPASAAVLYNHFGASCFECPAAVEETVDFAVRVHEAVPEDFYRDLADALEKPAAAGSVGRTPSDL